MQTIVKRLDPEGRYIAGILDRRLCIQREDAFYIKDLRIIANRRMEHMVIVDNMPFSFLSQLDNGIYVPSYCGQKDDDELRRIMAFLLTLGNVPDVRPQVQKFAGVMRLYAQYSNATGNVAEFGASNSELSHPSVELEM